MKNIYYITKKNSDKTMQDIHYLELLEICFIQDSLLEEKLLNCDCLVFTSKNAIFALEHFAPQKWQNLPCFVIGRSSQKILESFGAKAEFIAKNPYGDCFSRELAEILKNKKPLFVRAKEVASSLAENLKKSGVLIKEAILYETKILKLPQNKHKNLKPKKDSVIFFSAPSSIKAFLENFTWEEDYTALCIGKTTAKRAKDLLKNAKILLSPKVEIKASLEFAKTL